MTEPAHLNEAYDLDATAAWIREGGHARVALQMPDELLHDAVAVAAALARRCNDAGGASAPSGAAGDAPPASVRLFVLADTTFGSCCVDEVAAAHHDADAIVHFGRACMSPVARLPARFVFNKVPLDVPACAAAIRDHAAELAARNAAATTSDEEARVDGLVVLVDQEHAHLAAALIDAVATEGKIAPSLPIVVAESAPVEALPREFARSRASRSSRGACCAADASSSCAPREKTPATEEASASASENENASELLAGQRVALPPGAASRRSCAFGGVGSGESPALTRALAVLHGRCRGVAQFDPASSSLHAEAAGTAAIARVVKRRRYLIERARESRVIGIVAGTLGVAGYLTAIARVRELIARSGRTSYTVVAGKPNPQKLANFPEVEAFVLVACEQAALVDGRDYLQPVITPWEAEVAFTHGVVWDGEVRLDFEHLLEPRGGDGDEEDERGGDPAGRRGRREEEENQTPEFSFLGGGVRANANAGVAEDAEAVDRASDSGSDSTDGGDGVLGDGSRGPRGASAASASRGLALRSDAAVAARARGGGLAEINSGAEYLMARRTYVGLEPGPRRDEAGADADAPLEAAKGLSGRARGYAGEK